MLAKLTSKNQLTLPKAAVLALEPSEYFEVEVRDGSLVLSPVRIQRADAVRARLAELDLSLADITDAVNWARKRVAETSATYSSKQRKTTRQK